MPVLVGHLFSEAIYLLDFGVSISNIAQLAAMRPQSASQLTLALR
jgi:hypothetical protein